jgi:transcriptional regulator with XRE-family HTH domain
MAWGREAVGEAHSQAKLSDREVAQLREMASLHRWSQRELATMFGVSQAQVSAILANKARAA